MTQRFGGLFSPLNQREMTEFYRAVDFAVSVDTMMGDLDEYEEEIKSLESQPLDMLIEISEGAWNAINFSFFEVGGPGWDEGHKKQGERYGQTYWDVISEARLYMASLSKITRKLKSAQHKLQNEALD